MSIENKKYEYLPYITPFALFALLSYFGCLSVIPEAYVYPVKAIVTTIVLVFIWKYVKNEVCFEFDLIAVIGGIIVFLFWTGLEGVYPLIGNPIGFNPWELSSGSFVYILIVFRLFGASLVVPIIEELFWRSFALRFLIDTNFLNIRPGTFSVFSFILVSISFGFEHYRWLPGILAGFVYALCYYRTRNLFSPILAHAVTNLLLGIYVLWSGHWSFW
ncbi:MAG: CAAX prenyl protease-related protein [Desulfobacteraceae bacterium]|nr:CAAX prenyl protease-related protein [Desulfobacteraceae bacterium]